MKFVPAAITRSLATSVLKTKHNSPHIFFSVGVVGVVGATVLACRATLKLSDVLDDIEVDVDDQKNIGHQKLALNTFDSGEHYRDSAYIYGKGALELTRLYAPAIVVGGISIACLTGSHVQLTQRNAALTTTVGLLTTAYNEYRERVRLEVGAERELDLYHSAENKVVEMADGTKEIVKIVDPNGLSPYARFFDECSHAWEKDAELNRLYVQCQQNFWNHKLQYRGHVFLNEVYDGLGIEHSSAGAVVGWVLGPDGDNYIDFGLFEAHSRDFVNGQERSILLDFNVDGVVFDKIGGKK